MNLSFKQIGILVFAIITALLHLSLFVSYGFDPIVLNGLGYIALLGAYFLPIPFLQGQHKLVWWVMVGYTILTIVLWIILGDKVFIFGTSSATGYYSKAAELFLLGFLLADRPKA